MTSHALAHAPMLTGLLMLMLLCAPSQQCMLLAVMAHGDPAAGSGALAAVLEPLQAALWYFAERGHPVRLKTWVQGLHPGSRELYVACTNAVSRSDLCSEPLSLFTASHIANYATYRDSLVRGVLQKANMLSHWHLGWLLDCFDMTSLSVFCTSDEPRTGILVASLG